MSVYAIVTQKVMALLGQGIVPWKRPWSLDGSVPANLVSKREYRGVNLWLLPNTYPTGWFLSAKQIGDLGGTILDGQHAKGHVVVFWKVSREVDAAGNPVLDSHGRPGTIRMLRYYKVWNVDQCQGIEYPREVPERIHEPVEQAEQVIAHMPHPPTIQHDEARAWYRAGIDTVNVPRRGLFDGIGGYYGTMFHELAHSTGHPTRLARRTLDDKNDFGSRPYAYEELVAEMCSGFLCNMCGIGQAMDNTAAYIREWLGALDRDRSLLVNAAASAQKAADWILGRSNEEPSNHIEEPK